MEKPGLLSGDDRGGFGPPRWLLPLLAAAGLALAGLGASGALRLPEREKCEAVGGVWERTSSGGRYGGARCVMPDEDRP